ncbi:MAG TPA: ABC transporter permease, partial [Anaerolineales bacterium]|nr:ABC transporter permease [Anaerolineales bacterium]
MATTATTAPSSSFSRALRAVRIPPVYIFLIVIFLIGGVLDQIFSDGQIFTNPNIVLNIIVRSVALGIVAVGQTLVIVGASIDLSVAYLISVTAVLSSYIMQGDPARVPLAIVIVFAIGALVGLINGLVITKLNVNAFIATLGMSLFLAGGINASFSNYTGSVPKSFQFFGYAKLFNLIPVSIFVLLIIVIAGWLLLTRTKFGAHLYGVGGSAEVARLSGLRTDRIVILAHVLCSMSAVLTGVFLVSRLQSGAPWVGPDGIYDLESIATTVVGGTALSGGKGGVWGTLAGVLIFGVLDTVFNQLGVNPYLKTVLRGA